MSTTVVALLRTIALLGTGPVQVYHNTFLCTVVQLVVQSILQLYITGHRYNGSMISTHPYAAPFWGFKLCYLGADLRNFNNLILQWKYDL